MSAENPLSDPELDAGRLADPVYFEAMLTRYRTDPRRWLWYLNYHTHGCKRCDRVWLHTGLEAVRDGAAAHQCCGRDVRVGP